MLPKWEDRFSIHNAQIDLQHKKLFELAHKAYSLDYKGTTRAEIRTILLEFFDYMKTHFDDEEHYMKEIGYPEIQKHKRLHRRIIDELSKTIKQIHNVHDMRVKLKIVAQEWLLNHILHDDMLIEKYRLKTSVSTIIPNDEYDFVYICGCSGVEHKLAYELHAKIESGEKSLRCSKCKEKISFKEVVEKVY